MFWIRMYRELHGLEKNMDFAIIPLFIVYWSCLVSFFYVRLVCWENVNTLIDFISEK